MKKGSNANNKPQAFGKKRNGIAKNLNTQNGKKLSKYCGHGLLNYFYFGQMVS